MEQMIEKLLQRIHSHESSVIIVLDSKEVSATTAEHVAKALRTFKYQGTLILLGENEYKTPSKFERPALNRFNLFPLGHVLCHAFDFEPLSHPSYNMWITGFYAQYFKERVQFDFPHGTDSIFQDLYDLNAIVFSFDEIQSAPDLYLNNHDDAIVVGTAYDMQQEKVFLSQETPEAVVISQHTHCLSERDQDTVAFAIRFRSLVDFA